jgi:DNA replication and repair protein RecF
LIVRKLKVENFRNLQEVEIDAHGRLNYFHGANGAGKTSMLESLVVLSRGRSFRTTQAAELVGPNSGTFRVFALVESSSGVVHRLGLERSGKRWRGRMDGADLSQISQLTRSLPLVLMEPDSHLLVSGAPEVRRRYVDWGMFHVEPGFLDTWRNFSRALKQRNAALRSHQLGVLDSIDEVLAEHARALTAHRSSHCESLAGNIQAMLEQLNSGLPAVTLDYHRGWSGDDYHESLRVNRARDLERGMTLSGPHRADLGISCGAAPARAILSRGEQKVLAAALLLTQAELLAARGDTPVLLLDDLASEFDRFHFDSVLRRALAIGGQVWLTGTRQETFGEPCKVFHVERGAVPEVV